jgi:hypothetical protein
VVPQSRTGRPAYILPAMLIADGTSTEEIIEMDREDGMRAIRQIASCRPHVIAYGCTASSIIQGHPSTNDFAPRSGVSLGCRQRSESLWLPRHMLWHLLRLANKDARATLLTQRGAPQVGKKAHGQLLAHLGQIEPGSERQLSA